VSLFKGLRASLVAVGGANTGSFRGSAGNPLSTISFDCAALHGAAAYYHILSTAPPKHDIVSGSRGQGNKAPDNDPILCGRIAPDVSASAL
jgi:hypothetical protein